MSWRRRGGACKGRYGAENTVRNPSLPASGEGEETAMDARSSRYHEVYARWQRDPQGFWGEAAAAIDWIEKPKKVFDAKAGIYGRWFPGGTCNTCYNALDRHVAAGRNNQPALIYDSPVTNTKQTFTYGRLLSEVQ